MTKLRAEERQSVRQYVLQVSGIMLDDSKDYLIESRMQDLLALAQATSYGELIQRARTESSGKLRSKIIDAITTGETMFFRDGAPFELLRHKLFPEWADRNKQRLGAQTLRIWCAASSSGQEIYSIAMAAKETFGDLARYRVRILGTDISDEAIARSSAAVYSDLEISRGLSPAQRDRHFQPVAKGWKIRDELRSIASFRRLNLLDDFSGLGRFDLILCRNVAIYFDEATRVNLFRRMAQSLDIHGSLIVGSMESLGQQVPSLKSERYLRAVYYRLA